LAKLLKEMYLLMMVPNKHVNVSTRPPDRLPHKHGYASLSLALQWSKRSEQKQYQVAQGLDYAYSKTALPEGDELTERGLPEQPSTRHKHIYSYNKVTHWFTLT
jgi:hypothetical protein